MQNEDGYVYVLMEVDTRIVERPTESGHFEDYEEELCFVGVFTTREQAEDFMKDFAKERYPDRDFFWIPFCYIGISNKWRLEGVTVENAHCYDAVRNSRVKFLIRRIPFMPDVSIVKDIQLSLEVGDRDCSYYSSRKDRQPS